jgi:hypothetical protein
MRQIYSLNVAKNAHLGNSLQESANPRRSPSDNWIPPITRD